MLQAIIDKTYFVREVFVAGLEQPYVADPFINFINEHERIFLQAALGYAFYKTFWTALEANPAQVNGRWFDLVQGADYMHYSTLVRWKGLKQPDIKESMIAKYVYMQYMLNNVTQTAVVGETEAEIENSKLAIRGSAYKMARQWNRMIADMPTLWHYLTYAENVDGSKKYPEFKMCDVDCKHFKRRNTFGI